jgi:hypothetical protein
MINERVWKNMLDDRLWPFGARSWYASFSGAHLDIVISSDLFSIPRRERLMPLL